MKTTFYGSYAVRSLARGGQRTLLAIFCIAVGVMAIVGLQLVSEMVRQAITANARAVNQGDVSVGLSSTPLQASDLAYFESLKTTGVITGYTPLAGTAGIIQLPDGRRHTVSVRAVDPGSFPLVGPSKLSRPADGKLAQLLGQDGNAIVSDRLLGESRIPLGATLRVLTSSGAAAQVRLAGVVSTDNATWSGNSLTVSAGTWETATKSAVAFQTVAVTTQDSAHTRQALSAIRRQFPLANLRTTDNLLQQAERGVETVRKFLILIGLLALLIGGVGIVDTMQVLLSRRRVEIAVLKTSGYRRRDLYLLFAIEAALLGLAGGAAGASAGVAVAAGLRAAVVRAFPLVLPFVVDWWTILGGIAVGVSTALIFGVLPIVRAAAIRPQAVFRDLPEWQGTSTVLQSTALIVLLSLLFLALASVILKSLLWGLVAVYGVFILLALLSLLLGGIVWLLSRLPVPDRISPAHLLLVSVAVAITAGLASIPMLRGVGLLMLAFALLGYLVAFLPPAWRVNLKLALRNIGRTRGRTTITLLALLIGVFTVGFILVLGQDLRANLGQAFTNQLSYNVVAVSTDSSDDGLPQRLQSIPGLESSRAGTYAGTIVVDIDGRPVSEFGDTSAGGRPSRARQQLRQLSGVQGYEVGKGDVPGQLVEVTSGRNLEPSDAESANIIVQDGLQQPPLGLRLGSSVRLKRPAGSATELFTVVGFYRLGTSGPGLTFNIAPVFAPEPAAARLADDAPFRIFYLRVAQDQVTPATSRIEQIAPDVIVLDLQDFLTQFTQILNNILLMLTAIASLALAAGVIIVANAVALAMLERRRELGILKAVGYTSGRVLTGILMENVLTAGVGGVLGMAPVSVAVALFNREAGVSFGVGAPISIAIVLGVVALTTATALLVAWGTVRVRPLSILRYE